MDVINTDVQILKRDPMGLETLIAVNGTKFRRVRKSDLVVDMSKRPLLGIYKETSTPKIAQLLDLLNEGYEKKWDEQLKEINPKLDFWTLIVALAHVFLKFEEIDPDLYDALKDDVHPLSIMRSGEWYSHFDEDPNKEIDEQAIAEVFAKVMRYMRMIKMDEFYKALNEKKTAAYKALEIPAVMTLPYQAALSYQQRVKGDLTVGRLIPNTGWFYGGEWNHEKQCPACEVERLREQGNIKCCPYCKLGLIMKEV